MSSEAERFAFLRQTIGSLEPLRGLYREEVRDCKKLLKRIEADHAAYRQRVKAASLNTYRCGLCGSGRLEPCAATDCPWKGAAA